MLNDLEKYKNAASIMPGSVLVFQLDADDTMNVLFYSKKAKEMTGMEENEVNQTIDANGFNLIIESDQKVIVDKIKYAIANKSELDVIYRQHHKVHGIVWIHMKAAISGETDGKPVFVATMLDVTGEMLNSSNIMEASDRCICVIEKNTKLMLYGNTKFYELIDLKPSESMGIYCYDALCGNPAFKTDNNCLCFSTINIDTPFEYYNPENKKFISMYGREIMWGEHEAYVFYLTDQTEEKFKEKQLKNAQQRFEMTLDNSDLYIWEYDMINNQCLNPQKAVREYGLPPVIDNYPESLFEMGHTPPETIEQIKDVKRRLLNGETGFSVERRTVNAEGESQWMKVSYTLETDHNGRPARALVCGTDITEQKKKELEYEEELRLKKTVTSDTTVLAILNLSKDCVAENDTQSPVLRKFLELGSVNEIMNSICDEFIAVADREKYINHFSREQMLRDFEHGIMHNSFRHQFTDRAGWFESAFDLIVNPRTGDIEAVTTIKNVTDEVRTKQVVNKLTSLAYDSIITMDIERGEIYRYDRDYISGVDTGKRQDANEYVDSVVEKLRKFCSPREAERVISAMKKEYVLAQLNMMPVYSIAYFVIVGDQRRRKRCLYSYLDDSHETVLCVTQDITESYLQEEKQRKDLAEALEKAEKANKAKTTFLSNMSHDMRTPMNAIIGLSNLAMDMQTIEEMKDYMMKINLSGKQLLALINDTLDVSRIETGKLTMNREYVMSSQILNEGAASTKVVAEQKGVNFRLEKHGFRDAYLHVDAVKITKLFTNLLSNAVKFTPPGGEVVLSLRRLGEENRVAQYCISVRDTGIGMSKKFQNSIFEPFAQERTDRSTNATGTGLGMTIVKSFADFLGATIEINSDLGKGTEINVYIGFELADKIPGQVSKSKENTNSKAHRILVAEDHPLNAEIIRKLLEKKGYTVERAKNGQECVSMFFSSEVGYYGIILMDIRMPELDGIEATKIIRHFTRADAEVIPIIAMTANAFEQDVKECKDAGMNEHLSKPIEPEKLYLTLEKYLESEI